MSSSQRAIYRLRKLSLLTCDEVYKYQSLVEYLEEIRVLDLQPGTNVDDLSITLRSAPFKIPKPKENKILSLVELQKMFPEGWKVYTTMGPHSLRLFRRPDRSTTWEHPNPDLDPESWQPPEAPPPAGFEPQYEALSYVWGAEEPVESVYVDTASVVSRGSLLRVRPNLAAALKTLRRSDRKRTLWIDAICIDQSNVVEREQQVKRMGQIFSYASRVIVWLGPSHPGTPTAFKAMESLARPKERLKGPVWLSAPGLDYLSREDLLAHLPDSKASLGAITKVLSVNLVVSGSLSIDWQSMRKSCLLLLRRRSRQTTPRDVASRLLELYYVFENASCNVFDAIETSRRLRCTLEKDHIYGILGISRQLASLVEPDYSSHVPYDDVYKDVVLQVSNLHQRLSLLSQCNVGALGHAGPSWLSDWSCPLPTTNTLNIQIATRMSGAEFKYIESDILEVTVVLLGIVQNARCRSFSSRPQTLKDLLSIEPPDLLTGSYAGGQSRLDTFCATVTAGYVTRNWLSCGHPTSTLWQQRYREARQAPSTYRDSEIVFSDSLHFNQGRTSFELLDSEGSPRLGLGPISVKDHDMTSYA